MPATRLRKTPRRYYPGADQPPICEMSGRIRYRLAGIRLAKPRHLEDALMLYEVRTYTLRCRIRRTLRQAAAAAGETLQIGGLLAHRIRTAQSGHPRLCLR